MRLKIGIILWILAIGITDYFYYQKNILEGQMHLEVVGKKCGVVEDNFTELKNVKHGTQTEYYIKVRYSTGTVIEKVTAETWYNSNIGRNVCFIVTEPIGIWYFMCILVTFLSIIVFGIFVVISVIRFSFGFKPYWFITWINNI